MERAVALAGSELHAGTIDQLDPVTAVSDESVTFQRLHGDGDAGPVYSEHVGEEFLRQMQVFARNPVPHEEQPLRQPLLDGVKAVADQILRHLIEKNAGVTEDGIPELRMIPEKPAYLRYGDPGEPSVVLNDGRAGERCWRREDAVDVRQPLAPDDAGLDHLTAVGGPDYRNDRTDVGKVNMLRGLVGIEQNIADDVFLMMQARMAQISCRQGTKEDIRSCSSRRRHSSPYLQQRSRLDGRRSRRCGFCSTQQTRRFSRAVRLNRQCQTVSASQCGGS